MRVNLDNVLDEGLRIGGRGRRMNSNVKDQTNKAKLDIIETKLKLQAQSRSPPGRPLLDPLYRWLGLEVLVGFHTNSPYMAVYILFPYLITIYISSYLGS
jgi:hypothetical protein